MAEVLRIVGCIVLEAIARTMAGIPSAYNIDTSPTCSLESSGSNPLKRALSELNQQLSFYTLTSP